MKNINLSVRRQLCMTALAIIAIASLSCGSSPPEPSSAAAPTAAVPLPELLTRVDQLYEQREDLARLREGVALLRNARTTDAQSYDVAWRLAQFNYYLGAHTKDENERDNAFREGVEAGEAAVRLQAEKPEGHFWFGANMGGRAQSSSLSGLADAEDIKREMEAVIKLDESYQGGSAYMVLGQVDLELPRLMGGDPQQAVKNLEKGLKFGDDNPLLRLRLAEAYLATGRKDDARKQLDFLLNMKPNPKYIPEYKEATEEGRKLLSSRF
ncbi:MAG: tetratricopeptide repeat protein [Pyrinomonadaceae bacterium]|nr:tetratricopeptide repeat protein [Pyrinomonadaceae bacterium]